VKRRRPILWVPSKELTSITGLSDSEYRLRVFENRPLRRIFGPQRDEVTGGWRKLHNEALHNLYSSPSIIGRNKSMKMRWARRLARKAIIIRMCRTVMEKSRGKRPLRGPRLRWDDNVAMGQRENWIDRAEHRDRWRVVVNTVI
jgi:hypothetical protein